MELSLLIMSLHYLGAGGPNEKVLVQAGMWESGNVNLEIGAHMHRSMTDHRFKPLKIYSCLRHERICH